MVLSLDRTVDLGVAGYGFGVMLIPEYMISTRRK